MKREPGYLYPGDPGYPTGGPYAAMQSPMPIPGYRFEGDHPDSFKAGEEPSEADRALYERYTQGTPEDKAAALLDIQYELGIAGQDDSAGTSANVKLANWLTKASGHG